MNTKKARLRKIEKALAPKKEFVRVYVYEGCWYRDNPFFTKAEPISREEVEELRARDAVIFLVSYD